MPSSSLRNLIVAALLLALCACSGVSVTRLTDDDKHLTVHAVVITHVKHAEYERGVLLETLMKGIARKHPFWTICVPAAPSEHSADYVCDGDASGPDVSLFVVIKDIEGVSDTGNVYGGRLEGKGRISVMTTISSWDGSYLKHFSLDADGASEPIAGMQLARGITTAAKKIAQSIIEVTEDACPEIIKVATER